MVLALAYIDTDLSEPLEYVVPQLTLGVGSKPTLANAREMAISRESQLNAVLRNMGVTDPLTVEADISIIKLPLVKVVAADIWVAAYASDTIPPQYERYFDEWAALLEMIHNYEFSEGIETGPVGWGGTGTKHIAYRTETFD